MSNGDLTPNRDSIFQSDYSYSPTQMQFSQQSNVPATQYPDRLDLLLIFSRQINSSALAQAKLLSKRGNLLESKGKKSLLLMEQNWPPHILTRIKSLDPTVQVFAATDLLRKEIEELDVKIRLINQELTMLYGSLETFIKSTLEITLDQNEAKLIMNNQQGLIKSKFEHRQLFHLATFQQNRINQERDKAAKAASKPQKMVIDEKTAPHANHESKGAEKLEKQVNKKGKAPLHKKTGNKKASNSDDKPKAKNSGEGSSKATSKNSKKKNFQ